MLTDDIPQQSSLVTEDKTTSKSSASSPSLMERRKVRRNVKDMSPNTKYEYIREKNRINKAKSRERQRKQMQNITLEENTLPERDDELTDLLKPPHITPMSMYASTEEYLQVMFQRYPDFKWFMKNDPRTASILQSFSRQDSD